MNHLNNFSIYINLGFKYFLFIFTIILRLSVSTFGQERISYNNSGLKVDLGVGLWAWPLPMDYDEDGDFDLVVTCPDKPYNGTYFFENAEGNVKFPIFKPGRKIANGPKNVQISYIDGVPVITQPSRVHYQFREKQFTTSRTLPLNTKFHKGKTRADQWKIVDYNHDGLNDLIIGIGDWTEYGWDNAFDENGNWTRGPLNGFVYLALNIGSKQTPKYASPIKIEANGKPIDTYGMPSPNLVDFDKDGDLDLLCGEFLDGFTYYKNIGTRQTPEFSDGIRLRARMDLQMIIPVVLDWDQDGDPDIICGDEDGRVALIENTGKFTDKDVPVFLNPRYFQQEAAEVKFGALVTPVAFDWDNDGDEDLLCGNTAGYIGYIENLSGPGVEKPKLAKPVYLKANGEIIRLQAGKNGSIQGPCEAKWGYSTISVGDFNHDGLPDIVANGIWGKVIWLKNVGTRSKPSLAKAELIDVAWKGKTPKPSWNWWNPKDGTLATQWRTTPAIHDWDKDGTNDLIMLDHEGYLAFFQGARRADYNVLRAPQRIFKGAGEYDSRHRLRVRKTADSLLRLNNGNAGQSGRRKFSLADWDGDGRTDLLVNSVNTNLLRNMGEDNGVTTFRDVGTLSPLVLAGHTTSPTTVDWDGNGVPDLIIGGEDGFLYYHQNPRKPKAR